MGGIVRTLIILALVITTGYNLWQIQTLKAELAQLKQARGKAPAAEKPSLSRSLEYLRRSKQHADKAQALLKAQRFEEAAKETQFAADAAQKAYSGAQSSNPLDELQSTVQSLSKQVGTLWEHQKDQHPHDKKKDAPK